MSKNLKVTTNILITNIDGHSLYSLFPTNFDLHKTVRDRLAEERFTDFKDIDEREADHPLRSKVTRVLSLFEPIDFKIMEKIKEIAQKKKHKKSWKYDERLLTNSIIVKI